MVHCVSCGKEIHSLDKQDTCSPKCYMEAMAKERKEAYYALKTKQKNISNFGG